MSGGSTETLALRLLAMEKRLLWRRQAYGYIALTPREHEAMTLERIVRLEARGLGRGALDQLEDQANRAWYRSDQTKLEAARIAILEEVARLQKCEWGIQSVVARQMGIAKQTVSDLLCRGSVVMAYFALCVDDAFYGWRQDEDGNWWLAVPVAPIDPKTRRKLRK